MPACSAICLISLSKWARAFSRSKSRSAIAGGQRAAEIGRVQRQLRDRFEHQVRPGLGDHADGDVQRGLLADILGVVHDAARQIEAVAGIERELLA